MTREELKELPLDHIQQKIADLKARASSSKLSEEEKLAIDEQIASFELEASERLQEART